jgi:hypothetical protein
MPGFCRPPVSPREFFSSEYYVGPCTSKIYPKWQEELSLVCNQQKGITEWLITGSIGGGKTTAAVLAISYKVYYLSCLENPQNFYDLMPGHKIIIGLYNIFKYKVEAQSYHMLEEIVKNSPYFKKNFPRNPKHTTVLEFPNNISVLTGSSDLQIIGENLYILLLDEANFMRGGSDPAESQAYKIYSSALTRMASRFIGKHHLRPWLLMIVSSKKHESDFTSQRITDAAHSQHTHVSNYPIWEMKPPDTYSDKKFRVQIGDALRPSKILRENEEPADGMQMISVPEDLREPFETNIEEAITSLAGIATSSVHPLISHKEAIVSCIDQDRKHPFWQVQIKSNFMEEDPLEGYLDLSMLTRIQGSRRVPLVNPHVQRFIHVDIGLTGDALGICMGHPAGSKPVTRMSGDGMPYQCHDTIVYIDLMLRVVPDGEINLAQTRMFIIYLRDSLGFQLQCVTYDGFQSRESIQLLKKSDIEAELLSVDRGVEPYSILQRAVLERRVSFYEYPPFIKELTNLILDKEKGKVDHPKINPDGSKGSKDVCDAISAIIYQSIKSADHQVVMDQTSMPTCNSNSPILPKCPCPFRRPT